MTHPAHIAADIEASLRALVEHHRAGTFARMLDGVEGFGGGGGEGRGPANVVADPTGDAACRLDRAHGDMATIKRHLTTVLDIAARYAPREANGYEVDHAGPSREGCSSCERLAGAHGQARWEPVHVKRARVGADVVALCHWCYTYARKHGAVPPLAVLDAHHSGTRTHTKGQRGTRARVHV